MRTHALRFLGIAALALAACSPEQESVMGPPPSAMAPASKVGALGASSANLLASGTVGVVIDASATTGPTGYAPGRVLRFVGDPAPAGFAHIYQWANPAAVAYPETAPVVIRGVLDVSTMPSGSVALIGLLDRDHLVNNAGYQSGAYAYVYKIGSTSYAIGPSDGNYKAEVVQDFYTIPQADVVAAGNKIGLTLTIDGTVADPSTCASSTYGGIPDGAVPAGCIYVDATVGATSYSGESDTYGEITVRYNNVGGTATPIETPYTDHVEFGNGAVLGWDLTPAGANLGFALIVDPDDEAPTVSDVALDPASAYPGDAIDLSANAVAVGVDETVKGAEYSIDGGTWTAMTQGTGDAWDATFSAPTPASYPASIEVCVRATDGLTGTTLSDETSDGTACASLTVMEPDNDPPVLSALGATSASFGSPVSLSVNVTDAHSVTVAYTVNGGTNWFPMSGTGPTYTASVSGLSAGTYFACYKATDSFGNVTAPTTYTTGDPACTEFSVTADQMMITFDGQFVDEDGGQTTLTATVTPTACGTGATVIFEYTNLLTNVTQTATVTANGSGVASTAVTLDPGVAYDIEVSVADRDLGGSADPECLADSDMGSTMVLDPNAASSGGGWYAAPVASGSPRVNFGYTVNLKFNKKTGLTTVSGNLLWHNNEDSRLKGTITSYGKVACQTVEGTTFGTCALVGGTGMLYDYNPSYDPMDPASQVWINGRSVTFSFLAYDGGVVTIRKKKNNKPDAFGLTIAGQSVDAESAPMLLKGGNLIVK